MTDPALYDAHGVLIPARSTHHMDAGEVEDALAAVISIPEAERHDMYYALLEHFFDPFPDLTGLELNSKKFFRFVKFLD